MCGIVKLHPARGRKPLVFAVCVHFFFIAIYPRKGTETRSDLLHSTFCADCNLSPQGDENLPHTGQTLKRQHCNLSPQGDDNLFVSHIAYFLFCMRFSPVRGRKHSIHVYSVQHCFIAIYPRKGTKKHLRCWQTPVAEVLCFFLYSILQVGNCACRNRLCDRQRLDALRDVPLQGADLMQVGGDLLQGLFNVLCIQRQNTLAL